MSKNIVEPGRPQMMIYYAHALCMSDNLGYRDAINTHRLCNTDWISTATVRRHPSVTLYVLYITCLVFISYCWARLLKFVFIISISEMTQISTCWMYFNRIHPFVLLIFNKVIYSVLAQHQYIIINTLVLTSCFGFYQPSSMLTQCLHFVFSLWDPIMYVHTECTVV